MADPVLALLGVALVVALVALSAFFSSSEIAIFTLSEAWLDGQAASGDRRVQTLLVLGDDPHRLLVTILVGNNVVNVAIATTTTALFIQHLSAEGAVTAATVVASFVVLVFGEIVPKSYGLGRAEEWAVRVAGPLSTVERGLYPLVVVFDRLTRWMNARIGGETGIERPYVED